MKEIIKRISKEKKTFAKKLIAELEFMETTIEGLKEHVIKDGAVSKMENGSQNILIQHPAFKGYNTIISRYNATLKQLADLLPDDVEETDELLEFIK